MTIGRKASELGKLYAEGSDLHSDQPMLSVLREDTYVPNRRRAVLASHSEGRDLVMFDLEMDTDKACFVDGVVWVACVATTSEGNAGGEPLRGNILQIPWSVGASAVH